MAKRRNGVVKQLSNLSIDEVSLVDRGANQHALVAITKRAPEASDAFEFEAVEKKQASDAKTLARVGGALAPGLGGALGGVGAKEHKLAHAAGGVAGSVVGANLGTAAGAAVPGAAKIPAMVAGTMAGSALGAGKGTEMVENHYKKKSGGFRKALDEMDLDDLFAVEKKGSSFGRGGDSAGVDTASGSDPAGVLDDSDPNRDVGPGGKISGTQKTKGKKTPPEKDSEKGAGSDINPTSLSGLGKSADFWTGVIEKALAAEDEDFIEKHFPGAGGGGMDAQNPMNSPFPGAQGAGAPPTMQTPGVQPMGMGQPTPPPGAPPGQPTGGMPQQLPPDVIAYIQQLEQALEQAQGGSGGDSDNSDDSGNSDGSNDDSKKNPFGKSGDFGMNDNDLFLAELAKSLDEEDNRELIGKAYEAVSKAEERAQRAEEIAKQERDLRLEREFVAKAAEFDVPVAARDLGPVLKRLAESVSKEDFQVVVKCLRAQSEASSIYGEIGKRGGGDNGSILDEVEHRAQEFVGKSLTPEQAVERVFEMDPRAYDAYVAERRQALR